VRQIHVRIPQIAHFQKVVVVLPSLMRKELVHELAAVRDIAT
jgi:hypothetical protein